MQDVVGHCKMCDKEISCNDGFLNGVVSEDNTLICFVCSYDKKEISTFTNEDE